MSNNKYAPLGPVIDPLNETKEEWLARRIAKLENQQRILERNIKDHEEARSRSVDMIERLTVALADSDHPNENLVAEAKLYLNILSYGNVKPPKPHRDIEEHMKETREIYMKSLRENMKPRTYALDKLEEIKKAPAKKGKANDGNKGKTKGRR
jgi:hypothetical protein